MQPRRAGAQRLILPVDQEVHLTAVCGATAPHRARTPHGAEPLRGAAAPHRRTPPQSGTAPHRRLAAYVIIPDPRRRKGFETVGVIWRGDVQKS